MKIRLKTVYKAFMGEVNRFGIGSPCTFVRLAGCPLRCYKSTKGSLCDTPEALSVTSGEEVLISEVIDRVKKEGNRVICLTGGEPLMQENSAELVKQLVRAGFFVVIETSGAVPIDDVVGMLGVYFVLDVKSPSTGEHLRMLPTNYALLEHTDYVKFVVDTEDDYEFFAKWVEEHSDCKAKVSVGLYWGSKMSYKTLLEKLHNDGFANKGVYLNMQTHKLCCLYDETPTEQVTKTFVPREL